MLNAATEEKPLPSPSPRARSKSRLIHTIYYTGSKKRKVKNYRAIAQLENAF